MAHLPRSAPNTSNIHSSGTVVPTTSSAPSSSNRVTRSSARLADSNPANQTIEPSRPPSRVPSTKKRKAHSETNSSPSQVDSETSPQSIPNRRAKRQRRVATSVDQTSPVRASRRKNTAADTAMSSNGSSSKSLDEPSKPNKLQKRPTSRNTKKSSRGEGADVSGKGGNSYSTDISPSNEVIPRRQKKRGMKKDTDQTMNDNDTPTSKSKKENTPPQQTEEDEAKDQISPGRGEEEDQDPFATALFGRGASSGLSNTLRALSGMMSGMNARLRDILTNLRQVDNPTMQLIALEELSNLLLVSNEDNLSGSFSPDPYVKELVTLMQPNPITGEENPEIMLLACRSIANLMEALRGSVANVVYGGAVPVLCQKLLDIQYIDVAEQALSTLSKVSVDFPAAIVREGGLTACLQFLDFFATGTQRTAVTTAANCCRNIPHDSFPVIRDVMPVLQNVLVSHDQKVVEQGCLCVTRIIDSFKHSPDKLEQLIDPPLLRAVLGLLLPGTTNLIGANIHTEFLRVLAIVAKASPRLSVELLKMNVVDTLYQILTGVSPPSDTDNAASKIDSVVIMQALIHRPREQIYETLNVICELLPRAKSSNDMDMNFDDDYDSFSDGNPRPGKVSRTKQRLELLRESKQETRRFAMILLPTLTDAYSSTVNLNVRQKVLTAQLKMLSNLDTEVIEEALRPVPYASFLASILSQEDHPSLVMFALQASELLFERLQSIYQYQFYREGVIGEITKLASRQLEVEHKPVSRKNSQVQEAAAKNGVPSSSPKLSSQLDGQEEEHTDDEDNDEDDEHDDDDEDGPVDDDEIIIRDDGDIDESQSSGSSDEEETSPVAIAGIKDLVIIRAKNILDTFDTDTGRQMKAKALKIREDLRGLADAISSNYSATSSGTEGQKLFERLALYFDGDALQSITSSELLDSGIIRLLVDILTQKNTLSGDPRNDFLAAFMSFTNSANIKTATAMSTITAFSILVQKLQDLLSRAEHFEVLTVNSSAAESSRSSSTSMLSRQIRLKLSADAESEIPPAYRDMIVSIHAIATFKALDDYLRPRMTMSERPSSGQRRREMLQQLANARMAQLSGGASAGMFSPFGTELGMPSLPLQSTSDARTAPDLTAQSKLVPQEQLNQDKNEAQTKRRSSSRRNPSTNPQTPKAAPPEPSVDNATSKLECADEKALDPEEGDGTMDDDEALNAIVGELEEDPSEDDEEPAPVNMEVASSGRVTARQEDGTRVFTPQQPGTPVQGVSKTPSTNPTPSAPMHHGREHHNHNRPSSYAAAVNSIPQDWHIQFSIDGKVITQDTTIYRAIHHNRDQPQDAMGRGVWASIHSITFKKVKGPPPSSELVAKTETAKRNSQDSLPISLDGHPITSSILSLMEILHELNASLDDIRDGFSHAGIKLHVEPLASFINTKLTAKMNRQLEEPLIVASNCLPDWSEDLARSFPFLFPFETRHLFLQSTSFGYSRSITRWQNNQEQNEDRRDRRRDDRPLMGRPQRQKVRISRSRILESAMKVMEMYGASPSVLEVEYFEEVGTGLGPTLEFYSTVSKEFSKKKLKMWRENDSNEKDSYAFGKNGLFPIPMSEDDVATEAGKKLLHFFKMLGKFVARSMLDSRIIDVNFSPTFFRVGGNVSAPPSIALLRTVDQDLANSLAQLQHYAKMKTKIEANSSLTQEERSCAISRLTIKGAQIEDLGLDFTLPGYLNIGLIPDGPDIAVTSDNVGLYVERVLDMTLGSGVRQQIEAFQEGFSQVFAFSSLKAFTPNELVMLFGRVEEDWTIETLMDSIKADHGFNMDSKSVKNLLQTMSTFTKQQRRDFLQFVTGSPKLPIGGFKSLTPMFTVVCKPSEPPYSSDDYLPSVMTCVNYLKLPDYSNQEVMTKKLNIAIKEGQGAFHLS